MMTGLLLFILGLVVGSFLNVVIFRLHSGDSFVGGRSKCLNCKTELKSKDLVPLLSYLVLGGKCRYCKVKLSWQYPVVEFATGLAFLFVSFGIQAGDYANLIFRLAVSSIMIVVAVYDLKHYLILDKVIYPAMIVVLAWNIMSDFFSGCGFVSLDCATLGGVLAALIASGFFALQYFGSKGRWIGFGDVKLGLLLGLVAGFPGIIFLLFLAYILGAVSGLILIAAGNKELSSRLPFGFFLAISAIITMNYGKLAADWYLKLIGF